MKTPRLHNFLALVLALFTTVSLCAPGFACAANVTTGDIADASAAEPVEEERIAEDYDALEGEVHNTIDVSEADEEILPDDSLTTFATYDYDTELAKFPSSYRTLLSKLHKTYSKWIFVADETGLDFKTAVANEADSSKNVISPSICSSLMSSATDSSYASSNAVAYYMDPRNYLNKKDIFLFLDMGASSSCTADGVEEILSGTNLANSSTYYKQSNGKKVSAKLSDTYAKTIVSAASKYDMNAYFIASKIITETGGSLSKTATSGQNATYPNIYNFYNIGAYTSATDGLKWASSGSSYSRPWKNPALSIQGGASFIHTNYYEAGQNTEYFTKFNTSASATKTKYSHQYMSSLYGALNEAERMYKGYNATKLNGNYVFRIPVYKNMPSTCSLLSLSDASEAVALSKSTKKATATSDVHLRSGPATTYSSVTTIPSGATMTITGGVATDNANRAYQISNPYWFKATYGGESGYVSAECVSASTSYNIAKDSTKKLSYTRASSSDTVYFLSSNTSVATVSSSGTVTAKKNGTCMIYAFSGGGFDAVGIKVSASGSSSGTKKLSSSNATLSLSYTSHPYTGSALKPSVTVKYGSTKLKSGTDYTISYSNNKEPGTATVKITGDGNYSGSLSKTFKITALTAPYRTTANKVNYRTGCGTNYTAKGNIASAGTVVQVVYGWYKTVDGAKWYKVLINDKYYYMCGNYLSREVFVKYSANIKLNYRAGCGTNYAVKGKFSKGSDVSVVKGWNKTVDGEKWYKVKVDDNYYYAMATYLTKKETLVNYKTKSKVNVRSAAGTSKTLKTILLKDTPVSVIKGSVKTVSGDKWYQVKIGTNYYYMMASYLIKN